MSLMSTLAETYDACAVSDQKETRPSLVPVCHTTQQTQIEVSIDAQGRFCEAAVIERDDRVTIIPCTEDSASRSGTNPSPHPLFDKLQYLTPEYAVQRPGAGSRFAEYREQLAAWCASPFAHEDVTAVLTYLDSGTLLDDLAEEGVLYRAEDGSYPKTKPRDVSKADFPIFEACNGDQLNAVVRFLVIGENEDDALWKNHDVWQSWIDYQNSLVEKTVLCGISGELQAPSRKSPRNIRWQGDGAKLVSSNDKHGYTFRGRFDNAEEALGIGREANEKAHNALRWLISKQGYRHDGRVIVAWLPDRPLPKAIFEDTRFTAAELDKDTASFTGEDRQSGQEDQNDGAEVTGTGRISAIEFNSAMKGYRATLEGMETAAIVGLDSATPGRLSVFYYRETSAVDLLDNIAAWHDGCAWKHHYTEPVLGSNTSKPNKYVSYYGAPSPATIAKTIYGANASDKLVSKTIERLLPCIVEGSPIPRDIVMSAFRRASRPTTLEPWEAARAHSVACSLIRKYINDRNPQERITMETAKDLQDRDTKFGIILAYMRKIEEDSFYRSGQKMMRPTNAERLQDEYVRRPYKTMQRLDKYIRPYTKRLKAGGHTWLEFKLLEAIQALDGEEMTNKPLGPLYLIGYASQYTALAKPRKSDSADGENQANPSLEN